MTSITGGYEFDVTSDLPDDAFEAWWSHLATEDRSEFVQIYRGDDILARFVCALDYLALQKVHTNNPEDMFTLAYWIAAKRFEPELELEAQTTRNRAARAWKSDAVQSLYDRVKYRSVRQGSIRLQNKLFELGEKMADAALSIDDLKEQKQAADVLIKIAQLVDAQEQAVRAERTKKGLEKAREALSAAGKEEYSPQVLEAIIKAAREQMGTEKLLALVENVDAG